MKKKTIIILSVIAVAVVLCSIGVYKIISGVQKEVRAISQLKIEDVDISGIADGVYKGSYETTLVKAQVEVTVKEHKITDIKLLATITEKGKAAESITEDVVKSGSLQVDSVSGATHSSKVILKAIENALKNAVQS